MSVLPTDEQDGLVLVELPSGATFPVHEQEVDYFNERSTSYLSQHKFTNVSDLQDLDRILVDELLIYRWQQWISRKRDYWGDPIDENRYQRSANDYSGETRQLKRLIGIDKTSRDKAKGEDSVATYIASLLHRAKEFAFNRNRMTDKALELQMEMAALVTLHFNSEPDEQREQHCTAEDILEWLRDIAIPEFEEIDRYFRENVQSTWVRSQ